MLLVDRAVNLTMWSSFLFIFRQLHLSHQSLIFCLIFSALTFQIVYIDLVHLASVMAIEDNYYIIAQRYKNFLVKNISLVSTRKEKFGLSKQSCNVLFII